MHGYHRNLNFQCWVLEENRGTYIYDRATTVGTDCQGDGSFCPRFHFDMAFFPAFESCGLHRHLVAALIQMDNGLAACITYCAKP